ncbi:hypothetical protein ACHAWF_017483 [Thalassiosira exigua]
MAISPRSDCCCHAAPTKLGKTAATHPLLGRGAGTRRVHEGAAGSLFNGGKGKSGRREKLELLDVLAKNNFGQSALTEGFASGDTETVERLLNHESTEEEQLIRGLPKVETDKAKLEWSGEVESEDEEGSGAGKTKPGSSNDGDARKQEEEGIVHEFDFLRGCDDAKTAAVVGKDRPAVPVQELPPPCGKSPAEDTTGLGIWSTSLILTWWMASLDMVVLELAAGYGVHALAAAKYGKPASVTITDLNLETVDNIERTTSRTRPGRGGAGVVPHEPAEERVRGGLLPPLPPAGK